MESDYCGDSRSAVCYRCLPKRATAHQSSTLVRRPLTCVQVTWPRSCSCSSSLDVGLSCHEIQYLGTCCSRLSTQHDPHAQHMKRSFYFSLRPKLRGARCWCRQRVNCLSETIVRLLLSRLLLNRKALLPC